MTNALLDPWDTPFGLPPFAAIRDEDFAPAFDAALARGAGGDRGDCRERRSADLRQHDRGAGTGGSGAGPGGGGVLQPGRGRQQRRRARRCSAIWRRRCRRFPSEVTNNKALFARIEALWQGRDGLGLTAEQARVLMLYRRMFVRSGAALEGAAAERLTAVKSRLAVLGTQFSAEPAGG